MYASRLFWNRAFSDLISHYNLFMYKPTIDEYRLHGSL